MAKNKRGEKSRIKNRAVGVMMLPGDPTKVDPSPLEAFPEHAKYIAFILAEWSQIEYKMTLWLALRMQADNHIIFPMIYKLETSRARLDVMASALRGLIGDGPKVKGRLDRLLNTAASLLDLRVRYAHGHFGPDADSGELAIAGMGKRAPINIPLHELKHHFSRMKELSHELGVIVATELGVPLKGTDAPDSVPTHPLGLPGARIRREQQGQHPPFSASGELPNASDTPQGEHWIGTMPPPPSPDD